MKLKNNKKDTIDNITIIHNLKNIRGFLVSLRDNL